MNYIHLESFYTVVKCNGFTRAATHANKAQSAFSAQVALLERDLGVKLYDIVGKKIQLTPSGRWLYESIAPFFEGLVDLRRSIQNPEEGRLVIAATQNNTLYRLRKPLQTLRQRYPKIRLRLRIADTHQAVEALRSGDADLGLVRMPLDVSPDIDFMALPTTPLVLIAPPGHPIGKRKIVTPAVISEYPLIAYGQEDGLRQHCNRVFQSHGCTPDIAVEADSAEIVKAYVRAGFGLAIVAALDFLERPDPQLLTIPVDRYFGEDLIVVLVRRGRFQPAYVRFLLELLSEQFPARPGIRAAPQAVGGG